MLCDVSGKVTFIENKVTKEGGVYKVVKVCQEDAKGNVATVAVRVFDGSISDAVKVGDEIILDNVKVVAYKSGSDRVGLSADKW